MAIERSPEEYMVIAEQICDLLSDARVPGDSGMASASLKEGFRYFLLTYSIYIADADGEIDENEREIIRRFLQTCPTVRDMQIMKKRDKIDENILLSIPLAIQCYNYGKGNMEKVINCYSGISGRTRDEIINDQYGLGWADYRNIVKEGSSVYLDGVLSWMKDKNLVSVTKPDNNTVVELNIIRNTNEKVY